MTAVWPCHQQMSLQKPECLGRNLCFWPEIQTSVYDSNSFTSSVIQVTVARRHLASSCLNTWCSQTKKKSTCLLSKLSRHPTIPRCHHYKWMWMFSHLYVSLIKCKVKACGNQKRFMQQMADHIKFRRLLNAEAHDVQKLSLMAWVTMAEM